jgi:hypothetical protein
MSMLHKPGWDRSLARWRAFWNGELADRPPLIAHITPSGELDVGGTPSLERTIAYYDPARNGPALERAEAALAEQATLEDDTPPALTSGGGVYFTGAVFGAPVRVTADMMTAEPILEDWGQAAGIGYDPQNVWITRALGLARQLVARSQGRYAVTPGLIEGPSDICASLRSPTRLASDLYEHPGEVRRLAEMGVGAWQQYTNTLYEIIPLYDGGTATQWNVWTPGRGAALQEDFCTLISPRQFREFFLPLDRQLAKVADIAWMHVHAGALHLVDELLTVDEIQGIQIVYDGVVSPPLSETIPVMQRVQRGGKCLIVRKYTPQDLAHILPHLSPRRLALDVYFTSPAQAREWMKRLERWEWAS